MRWENNWKKNPQRQEQQTHEVYKNTFYMYSWNVVFEKLLIQSKHYYVLHNFLDF